VLGVVVAMDSSAVGSKRKVKSRAIVGSDHLSTLIASYNIHYSSYSDGRSKVTQVIPSAVWKKVTSDEAHDNHQI
jgi:hypothetical protein